MPKKFDVWVLKKDGCVFDFDYIARPALFDRGVPRFEAFVRGFQTVDAQGRAISPRLGDAHRSSDDEDGGL